MNKQQFIDICKASGYCSKAVAKEYAKDKEHFTEDDFREVFLLNVKRQYMKNRIFDRRYQDYQGARSTKHFSNIGANGA